MSALKRSLSGSPPTIQPPAKRQKSAAQSLSYPSESTPPKSIPFQQPLPLLTFSYTPERVMKFDNSALKYFVEPPPGADLSYGYERWIRRPDEKGRIDALLRAWDRIREGSASGGGGIGIVSWRGVMTKILTAPYEERDAWELNIMDLNGTLYLEEHLTEQRLDEKNNMPPRQRMQTYYGYSFESWCTCSSPHTRPSMWGGDVDTNVQWCSVVKTKLGDTRLVIGGEVDCVRGPYSGRNDNLVELKTSMNIRGPQDEARFEKKLLKFYFQSFLLGVPEILVGFRTPAGRITTTQSFKTLHLPRLVRGKPNAWDPARCLDWGADFISFVKQHIEKNKPAGHEQDGKPGDDDEERPARGEISDADKTEEDGGEAAGSVVDDGASVASVWRVSFRPGQGVTMHLLDAAGVEEVQAGSDDGVERVGFLPRWYWDKEMWRRDKPSDAPQGTVVDAGNPRGGAVAGWQIA